MAAPKKKDEAISRLRAEAWIGDAVLALFVRRWIIQEFGEMEGEMFVRFTSNDFLSRKGKPTEVEAEIGRLYDTQGEAVAFEWIRTHLLPIFQEQERAYQRKLLTQTGRKGKMKA
jgi:dsRNA-specific ribonuclease